MTLTSATNRTQAAGTGSQTSFSVTWVFWDFADLEVVHTDAAGTETTWVRGTQYNITDHDDGVAGTGTVTVVTSPTDYTPASGETLTFRSILADTQPTDIPVGGPFSSTSVEDRLDKIVRLIQQKAEALGRAIKLPVSSANSGLEIPDPSASKFLRWNAGATALENADIATGTAIGVPVTIAQGGTNATTEAAARTNLGLAIGTDVQAYDADTAKLDTAQEWTAQQNFNSTTLTYDATQDWAVGANQVTSLTLTGNTIFDAPTGMVDGAFYHITIIQDGTGSRTASWNSVFKFAGGAAPTLTTTASARDHFAFISDGTNMYEASRQLDIK
jgi:hypothetical protein